MIPKCLKITRRDGNKKKKKKRKENGTKRNIRGWKEHKINLTHTYNQRSLRNSVKKKNGDMELKR